MEIILIRHGQSVLNKLNSKKTFCVIGQYDTRLSEKGKRQARSLKDDPILKDADCIYSSDLKRAVLTAKLLSNGQDIIIDKRLRERSLGDFEGKPIPFLKMQKKYRAYFKDATLKKYRHDYSVKAPNGENYSDVSLRANAFLNEILLKDYKKVIIVAHFCTIRCILQRFNNLSNEETLKLKIKNCSPIIINS